MPKRTIGFILLVATLGFITIGDRVLPRPLSTYSRNTRQQLDRMLVAVLPKPEPERPGKKREVERDEFLRRAQPSP